MKTRQYSIVSAVLAVCLFVALMCGQSLVYAEHTHDFSSGRCSCGALKIEAETGVADGTPQINASTGVASFLENELYTASGGLCIGYWGANDDNKLTIAFSLSADVAEARIELTLAESVKAHPDATAPDIAEPADDYGGQNWTFKFRVNGKYYGFEQGDIPANDGSYENWGTIVSYPLPLKQGTNTVIVEACGGNQYNFDYFVVDIPSDVDAEYTEIDTTAPMVDIVQVAPYKPYAGETVRLGLTATDNETATDKLTVAVKVYYNYKKSGSKMCQLNDENSFVPTKAGKYTVIVTVTDEAGNATTRTRIFNVAQGEWKEPVPLPPKEPMDVGYIVGIVALCVAFGGAGIATAVTLILRKKRGLNA